MARRASEKCGSNMAVATRSNAQKAKEWCDTDGTGDRHGAWGIGGTAGWVISYVGTVLLLLLCPLVVIYL